MEVVVLTFHHDCGVKGDEDGKLCPSLKAQRHKNNRKSVFDVVSNSSVFVWSQFQLLFQPDRGAQQLGAPS